jgi:hypothetical protein
MHNVRHDGVVAGSVSVAWGLVVAVAAYAIMRAVQSSLYPEPNPSAVIWSAHAGYYWRVWTASYAGGIAAFVVLLTMRGGVESSARVLVAALGIAAALLGLQAALFP